MKIDSLEQLCGAFGEWRAEKKYRYEKTPEQLVKRARLLARKKGVERVIRAVKVDRRRLSARHTSVPAEHRAQAGLPTLPSYSRLPLMVASNPPPPPPFAELEMPGGFKLRLYSQTQEAMHLLTLMFSVGAAG